jgi:hypothetical protein
VGLFRRRETLVQRLLREGTLDGASVAEPDSIATDAPPRLVDVIDRAHLGVPRAREFETLAVAEAPELAGDTVEFVALPDGDLIVLEQQGEGDLSSLADAVEQQLEPPYRARGVRKTETLWSVAAIRIDVVRMDAPGERIELAAHEGERTATVDGEPTWEKFPELERLGERVGDSYAVRAERLDSDVWQAKVSAL